MLTSIITITTNATEKGPHNDIELADFVPTKPGNSLCTILRLILFLWLGKTLMGTHWIKSC